MRTTSRTILIALAGGSVLIFAEFLHSALIRFVVVLLREMPFCHVIAPTIKRLFVLLSDMLFAFILNLFEIRKDLVVVEFILVLFHQLLVADFLHQSIRVIEQTQAIRDISPGFDIVAGIESVAQFLDQVLFLLIFGNKRQQKLHDIFERLLADTLIVAQSRDGIRQYIVNRILSFFRQFLEKQTSQIRDGRHWVFQQQRNLRDRIADFDHIIEDQMCQHHERVFADNDIFVAQVAIYIGAPLVQLIGKSERHISESDDDICSNRRIAVFLQQSEQNPQVVLAKGRRDTHILCKREHRRRLQDGAIVLLWVADNVQDDRREFAQQTVAIYNGCFRAILHLLDLIVFHSRTTHCFVQFVVCVFVVFVVFVVVSASTPIPRISTAFVFVAVVVLVAIVLVVVVAVIRLVGFVIFFLFFLLELL
mmetsp:Transcript_52874/g.84240  ORF Transcript_52874/g.84240 Transcript_52874/m.84240 type:complete len:421 (+) Transcript_52874:403-1665(+)